MGYQAGIDDTSRPGRIALRSVSASDFELLTPFAYVSRTGQVVEVPIHPNEFAESTDLASVPPLLWGLLPSYGRQLRAALVLAIDLIVRVPPLRWLTDRLPWGFLRDNGTLLLIWVAALLLSGAWRRDWLVPFIGVVVGPLILPVLLVTFVAQIGLGLPDWVLHRIWSAEQPPANFGPTVTQVQSARGPRRNASTRRPKSS